MLFFLLKMDRRLRLHLFVLGLIVCGGIFTDKTAEGLMCHMCTYGCENELTVDCPNGSCSMVTVVHDGIVFLKTCERFVLFTKCANELFPGTGGCYVSTKETKNKMKQCIAAASGRDGEEEVASPNAKRVCFCNTDLCNAGGRTTRGGTTGNRTTGNRTTGNRTAVNRTGHRHSSNNQLVLFFTVFGATAAGLLLMKV